MAKVTNWQCDECKETMREAYRSSWLLITTAPSHIAACPWDDQLAEGIPNKGQVERLHICGQECALKVFSRQVGTWSQWNQAVVPAMPSSYAAPIEDPQVISVLA